MPRGAGRLPRHLCCEGLAQAWRLQGRVRPPGAQAAGCTGVREHFPHPLPSRGGCPTLAATDSTLGPNLASSPDSSTPCGAASTAWTGALDVAGAGDPSDPAGGIAT